MNQKQHLKLNKEFLCFEGDPAIHLCLDLGFSEKYEPQYHKLTHDPKFIKDIILPVHGKRGEIEAWLHLLADWGFFNDVDI